MNEALKIKWIWRFAKEEDAFWRKVIVAKYGVDNLGWWSKKSHYVYEVGCWKSILAGLDLFKTLVCFQVGFPGFCFGRMCGVEKAPLSLNFLTC